MEQSKHKARVVRNRIRLGLLLLILPVVYLGLWISISGNDALTYFEKVQMYMGYFPESVRNPFGITLSFFGMSLGSAIFSFSGYLKSRETKTQIICLVISGIATLLTLLFGFQLL